MRDNTIWYSLGNYFRNDFLSQHLSKKFHYNYYSLRYRFFLRIDTIDTEFQLLRKNPFHILLKKFLRYFQTEGLSFNSIAKEDFIKFNRDTIMS